MSKPSKKPELSYAQLQAELAEVLADLQRDDLDVDVAVQRYERGLALVVQLETYLASAENRITELQAKFSSDA